MYSDLAIQTGLIFRKLFNLPLRQTEGFITSLVELLQLSLNVPDDNPYSEAHFKTMKYRPDYPDRFGCLEDVRTWAQGFFGWYNFEHHHTGLGLMVPAMVHYGQATTVQQARQQVLKTAFDAHPERFVNGLPTPPEVPDAVWINKPKTQEQKQLLLL